MSDDITADSLSGVGGNVTTSDGIEAVDETSSQDTGVKDVLNELLGKNFTSEEAARKAVKDTFNFVGSTQAKIGKVADKIKERFQVHDDMDILRIMEEVAKQPEQAQAQANQTSGNTELVKLARKVEDMEFFGSRPEYADFQTEIRTLRDALDKPIAEIVEMPAIKSLVDKAKAHVDDNRTRSVIHSNPKLGQVTDKLGEARVALQEGRKSEAEDKAVDAVLDAFLPNR